MRPAKVWAQWSLGVLLVSWRYLWATVPLHRATAQGDRSDWPPALPEHLVDDRSQPLARGVGPLFHRLFAVDIAVDIDAVHLAPEALIEHIAADLNRAMPREVASVENPHASNGLRVGDELVVRIPGPWNGPVRVVHRDKTSFRLATLAGHMEAGQIEFRIRPDRPVPRFEIEAWARPGDRVVHLLYTHLWLAREVQLNMWVRFCLAAARLAHGRPRNGVTINTRIIKQADQLACCARGEQAVRP